MAPGQKTRTQKHQQAKPSNKTTTTPFLILANKASPKKRRVALRTPGHRGVPGPTEQRSLTESKTREDGDGPVNNPGSGLRPNGTRGGDIDGDDDDDDDDDDGDDDGDDDHSDINNYGYALRPQDMSPSSSGRLTGVHLQQRIVPMLCTFLVAGTRSGS